MSGLACGHDARCWIDECPPGCGEADRTHCLACRAREGALEDAAKIATEGTLTMLLYGEDDDPATWSKAWVKSAANIAAAILALKETP